MPPRRRSKKNADADADNASARSTPPPSGSFTIGPLLQDIDIAALSNFFPDAHLESPSAVLVVQCYKLILNQAQLLDEKERNIEALEAEAERKEIELDQALQDRENLLSELDVNVKDVQDELAKVKAEKEEIASSRDSLKADLERISSSQSTSSHEVADLRKKIEEVEGEKRNLLGVVSRLQEDVSERDQEINRLRESLKAARKEMQELESTSRDIRASERSTAFKVETLTHQLQLTKDECERANVELSKKTEDYSNYRRDKHTELVQLQSELDAVKQSYNQTLTNLRTIQTSHNKQSQQLSQALQKVNDLQNQLADQEVKYSSEAANLRRLVQMMEERESQAKELVAGIEKDWEGLGEKAAENEQKLRDTLEAEQKRTRELEEELYEMKSVLDRVNSGELPIPSATRTSPNVSSDSLFGLSPNISMINRMQKSGKTFTEVYAEYVKMQGEIANKQRNIDHLQSSLSGVLAELEEASPALNRQKQEIERVQLESDHLATQLSRAIAERDTCLVELQNAKKTQESLKDEVGQKERLIGDVILQNQGLLKEVERLRDATLPSDVDMAQIQPASNVDEFITSNLVLYKSIPQLVDRNMTLLSSVRELTTKMEREEQEYKAQLESEQSEAVREAHQAIMALQDQLENVQASHQATIQAYVKERDTLKTMLARYERSGTHPPNLAIAHPQLSAPSPQLNGIVREPTELEKELEEVRGNFEAYRKEMGVDTVKLREEALQYQREASQLGAALAKANARIEFLSERHRMAQEQYVMHEREAQNLQKRNQQLHEQYTRLDIACNHAAEELASANSQIERLRNECSNLRAEKKIWENVQTRLLDENKVLSLERSRIADLVANVQKMHNDIDNANETDRRRFETQIHTLEAQAQDLRTQLSRERETIRQISLQKDVEVQELRTKVDRSVENLSKARESLVESETSRKHLQQRVEELIKQVQMNEEKIAVYERRTSVTIAASGVSRPPAEEAGSEQDLKAEVAELRAALKAAEVDLATARSHVQQFQGISQASEAALQSLSETHDEYKASSEAQIAKFEAERKSLEERISSLQDEMSRLTAKSKETQQTLEKERAAYAEDKRLLEDAIVAITHSEVSSRSDQASREKEIREQMERAKAAEEKYAREILAHAESIKVVDSLKSELNELRASLREKTNQAETAQANLVSSEASWNQQREALNKEIADLTTRCKDLAAQNSLLHQHLESVSSQASRIRQAADSSVNVPESDADDVDGRMAELRSVVAYLRKEKEIVDLQLELSKQESARQRTQIEHLSQALEETRAALSNEREEAAKAVSNSAEHTELLERINQLNIVRESNATLRAESEAQARKARQLETSLNHLQSELDPLKEEAKTLRAELGAKDAQIRRLEDENRQWKERNAQLLTKYDRIDPNDVQALKDEIEDLQIDLRKAEEEKAAHTSEREAQTKLLEDTQATLADFRAKYASLGQESRNRLGQLNQQISKLNETVAELRKQVKDLTDERDRLATQTATAAPPDLGAEVESLKSRLAAVVQEREMSARLLSEEMNKAAKAAADHEATLSALREERDKLLAEKTSGQNNGGTPSAEPIDVAQVRRQLESEKEELSKARDESLARARNAEERAAKALNELRDYRLQNEKFQARIAESEKRKIADAEKLAALTEKHKQEQEQAVNAATEKLRSELQNPGADIATITARHAQELRDLEVRLVAKHEHELKAAIEKAQKEAKEEAAKAGVGAASGVSQDMISKEEHEQALKAATERGRMESTTKLKLKDGMLQKAQMNVKHLEAQIKAWREAGIIPANAPTIPPGSVATPVKATAPTPVRPNPIAGPSTGAGGATAPATGTPTKALGPPAAAPAGPSTPTSATPAVLPKKPMLGVPSTSVVAGNPSASARGGRGGAIVRGVRGAARGVARGGAVRGGAPAAIAQAAASNSTDGGVSIMGAAAKRARDEATENAVESLAKRIKPAEGSTTAAKPVALRRDRIVTTPNAAPPS